MHDSEVHSLIVERLNEIEDDDLRQFLNEVLRHEREIISEPRGGYKDEYKSLVDGFIDNEDLDIE